MSKGIRFFAFVMLAALCAGSMFVACEKQPPLDTDTPPADSTDTTDAATTADTEPVVVFRPLVRIVNKDGADATVSYILDDGDKATATFAKSMLDKYENLSFSFAIQTKKFMEPRTERDENGVLRYVMEDGKYVFEKEQQSFIDFWKTVLDHGRTEIVSHTHSHIFWGTNDDGGKFEYVNSSGKLLTSAEMPVGSVTKELYASKQILQDLFPIETYPTMKAVSLVEPGISVKKVDFTVDGTVIPTYKTYYDEVVLKAIENGDYIGSRASFQQNSKDNLLEKVNRPNDFKRLEGRMSVNAYAIFDHNSGENIENWTAYIDAAVARNGLATYCIHKITPTTSPSHHILESQAEALFSYTADKNIWVATFTDAMLYYFEWSTADVSAVFEDNAIKVTLTDKEENNELFNMPLTVRTTVPEDWSGAVCNGEALEIHKNGDDAPYVYVNIVPDTEPVIITQAQ